MLKRFFNQNINNINKIDIITLLIIMFLYALLAFYKLGDTESIQTFYEAKKGEEILIELEEPNYVIRTKLFIGRNQGKIKASLSKDNIKYNEPIDIEPALTFFWEDYRIAEKCKYIKLNIKEDISLGEIGLYGNDTEYIKIKSITVNNKSIKEMTDEKNVIPKKISYMNSSYFDEYYFARAAYEYVNGYSSNEWTHPPLGKVIQAIPIYLTKKMTPFNFRLMGNISGILLVGVMYIFGAILFKKRKYAIASSLLMVFDTFHFAQTRMGTVDSHLVLFITLSIMFMYLFINKSKTRYLLLSGLFFTFSITTKWTGFYGGIVLAILYFTYLIKNNKINIEHIGKGFGFFVIIPMLFYMCIYLLFPNNYNKTNTIKNIIKEQTEMYNFHSKNKHEHPFSSKWYTWPASITPVWLFVADQSPTTTETISGVGNLVIWYIGIISTIFIIIYAILKRDKISLFLLVTIFSLWLPYAFIKRAMFLYHYFPVLPFLFLGIIHFIKKIETKYKQNYITPIIIILSATFFIIYYPIVSGKEITIDKANKLELFDTWIFTSE